MDRKERPDPESHPREIVTLSGGPYDGETVEIRQGLSSTGRAEEWENEIEGVWGFRVHGYRRTIENPRVFAYTGVETERSAPFGEDIRVYMVKSPDMN